MYVSHRYKLFFFEVPRTASRSISEALLHLDPLSPTMLNRMMKGESADYHKYDRTLVTTHPDYSLVAVHRNPYERILSHFKLRKKIGNPAFFKTINFAEYVDLSVDVKVRQEEFSIDLPIDEMLDVRRVTHWLRFAHLQDDWQDLADKLQISLPKLPHINQSESDSSAFYTEDIANKVGMRMRHDFGFFNYDINSWHTLE